MVAIAKPLAPRESLTYSLIVKFPVFVKLKRFPTCVIPEPLGYPHEYVIGAVPPVLELLNVTEAPTSIAAEDGVIVTDGSVFTVIVLVMLALSPAESLTVAVTEYVPAFVNVTLFPEVE